jgi:hypothetical protein
LHLKKDFDLNHWYQYQTTNIVFNIYDDTAQRLSGCDYDGDLVLTTPLLNKFVYGGNIPYYERKTAEKQLVVEEELWKNDATSFGSKVGLLTNFSTSIFSMLPLFEKDSVEEKILTDRLKIATALQSQIIDSQKGIRVMPFPSWWADKEKEEDKDVLSEEEKGLYERVRVTKRPYFFKYVYDNYTKLYNRHLDIYENLSQIRMGLSFSELQRKENKTQEELDLINNYHKYSPLLDSPSIMNKICHHMEQEVAKIRKKRKNPDFNWHIYLDDSIEFDPIKLELMRKLYKEFSNSKRSSHDSGRKSKEQKEESIHLFRKKMYEISSNLSELTNLVVKIAYDEFPNRSKDFVWKLIPNGLIFNLNKNNITRTIELPFENKNGLFEYLNKKYEWYTLEI